MIAPALRKRAFNEREAAEYIGMSVAFLRMDRCYGPIGNRTPGPRWHSIGQRAIRYFLEDLDAWLDQFPAEIREKATQE